MNLTDAQREAIDTSAPALQLIACAGSGKTEVLARRVVRLLLEGTPPECVVAFTFTQKAAVELKERIEQRAAEADEKYRVLPPCATGLFIGTMHSYCLRVLQEYGGDYEVFDPLPEEREWALLHRFSWRLGIVDLLRQAEPETRVSVKKAVELFRKNLAVVYNERIPDELLIQRAPQFAQVVRRYEKLLKDMQLLSFDQMIERTCNELRPGGSLRGALAGRVREVLVDEYQDLNRAQEEVLQRLVELGARVTVVGDDDQAIYQWRGGDVSLCLGFAGRYQHAQRKQLVENRRSVAPIVEVASEFAETITERVKKAMVPKREACGAAIEMAEAETPEEEAAFVAARIRYLLSKGHAPSDIAVLFRSVRTSAKPVIDALRREGIPISLAGRLSLLDRPEMALAARVFVLWAGGIWRPDEMLEVVRPDRLASDIAELTGTDVARSSLVVGELQQLGEMLRREKICDLVATFHQMLQIMGLPADGPDRPRQEHGLGRFSQLLADFEHAQRRAAPKEWLTATHPSASQEVEEDNAVLEPMSQPANRRTGVGGHTRGEVYLTRLRAFLEQFASQAAEESPESPALAEDAVAIMTVHRSKGLEFPIVFVPSLVDGRFPSARSGQAQLWYVPSDLFDQERYEGQLDDERRLFYVAMTRAKELLVLSWFTRYERTRARTSEFIKNLGAATTRHHLHPPGRCSPASSPKVQDDVSLLELELGSLVTFSECPYKYYLRHTCGFQPPIVVELGYGKAIHHCIAQLARAAQRGEPPSVDAVHSILSRSFYLPFASPLQQERFYKAAKNRLASYVRNHGPELLRTIYSERRFEVAMDSARIIGKIDLILQAEGSAQEGVEIVDFKTAANRPPSEQHKNQLRLYAAAARMLGMNPVRLVIHDLQTERGGRIFVEEDPKQLDNFRRELSNWIACIRLGDFQRRRRRDSCSGCEFRQLCRPF